MNLNQENIIKNIVEKLGIDPAKEPVLVKLLADAKASYPNVEFEAIPLAIASTGLKVDIPESFRTEEKHSAVIGILLNITDETFLPGSTMKLYVDEHRVFDGEEAKLIYPSINVPPSERWYKYITRPINKSQISGWYQDGGVTPFVAYTATFYLMCLRKDNA